MCDVKFGVSIRLVFGFLATDAAGAEESAAAMDDDQVVPRSEDTPENLAEPDDTEEPTTDPAEPEGEAPAETGEAGDPE